MEGVDIKLLGTDGQRINLPGGSHCRWTLPGSVGVGSAPESRIESLPPQSAVPGSQSFRNYQFRDAADQGSVVCRSIENVVNCGYYRREFMLT